jgi:hypothetical protein
MRLEQVEIGPGNSIISEQTEHETADEAVPQAGPSSELVHAWPRIRALFSGTTRFVVASVNEDGSPHLTPIGSIHLRDDCTGYYMERFTRTLPRNLRAEHRICVYAETGTWLSWMSAMVRGRFRQPIAVRLAGRAGERRRLTHAERDAFLRKVRPLRWTRGHDILWGEMTHARELAFEGFTPVRAGRMTRGLWPEPDPVEVTQALEGADHVDVKTAEGDATLSEFIAGLLTLPWWVQTLMHARGVLARALGLRHPDEMPDPALAPEEVGMRPGEVVRFFTVRAARPERFWVADAQADRHLDATLVVTAERSGCGTKRFRVITAVRFKHWTGRLYFALIRPFHDAIIWLGARRAARASRR